jgi:hypothetical protein
MVNQEKIVDFTIKQQIKRNKYLIPLVFVTFLSCAYGTYVGYKTLFVPPDLSQTHSPMPKIFEGIKSKSSEPPTSKDH